MTKVPEAVFYVIQSSHHRIKKSLLSFIQHFYCLVSKPNHPKSKGGRTELKVPWEWELQVTGQHSSSGMVPGPRMHTFGTKLLSGRWCQPAISQNVCSLAAAQNFEPGIPKAVYVSQHTIYKSIGYSKVDCIRPKSHPYWQVPTVE